MRSVLVLLTLLAGCFAHAEIDQVCHDSIGSVAVINRDNGLYTVTMTGPAVAEFAKLGLAPVAGGDVPPDIKFFGRIEAGPTGSRIVQNGQKLNFAASWIQSALQVSSYGGPRHEHLNWNFPNCLRH